jgi:hypothetical protein
MLDCVKRAEGSQCGENWVHLRKLSGERQTIEGGVLLLRVADRKMKLLRHVAGPALLPKLDGVVVTSHFEIADAAQGLPIAPAA